MTAADRTDADGRTRYTVHHANGTSETFITAVPWDRLERRLAALSRFRTVHSITVH